jgi:hypothetical protein
MCSVIDNINLGWIASQLDIWTALLAYRGKLVV